MSRSLPPSLPRPARPARPALRRTGLLAAGTLLALTACGTSSPGTGSAATDEDPLGDVRSSDVPAECVEAFPLAVEPADLADVTLRPADFPDPPVEGTLCQTSSTLDDSVTTADYATPVPGAEVLDAYEEQLAAYDVVREDQGAGETLSGLADDGTSFLVSTGEGRYSVAFSRG